MSILCLDLGTKAGFAVVDNGAIKESGVISYNPKKSSFNSRYSHFNYMLDCICSEYQGFDSVAYEKVMAHKGVEAAHVYGGFYAVVEMQFSGLADIVGVHVGTIKKSFTGKGNASKQMMIDEAISRGHKPVDDNEADAIALAYYVIENKI